MRVAVNRNGNDIEIFTHSYEHTITIAALGLDNTYKSLTIGITDYFNNNPEPYLEIFVDGVNKLKAKMTVRGSPGTINTGE